LGLEQIRLLGRFFLAGQRVGVGYPIHYYG